MIDPIENNNPSDYIERYLVLPTEEDLFQCRLLGKNIADAVKKECNR
jgi:hypothetical protein